jgi:hypothetical protein
MPSALASVREPSASLFPILRHTPSRCFATLVAVQKKNSPCEPNFKTAQPHDPKGVHEETGENSGYQVAQADGMTNRTLRTSGAVREPSSSPIPILRHTPSRCFATLVAVQKKNSLCEPNFKSAQPHDPKGVQEENAGNSGYQVAQADSTLRPTPPLRPSPPQSPRAFATLIAAQKKHSRTNPIVELNEIKGERTKNGQLRHRRGADS